MDVLYRDGRGKKLQHDKYTGSWRVEKVLVTGISVEIVMQGRELRTLKIFPSDVEPHNARPPH